MYLDGMARTSRFSSTTAAITAAVMAAEYRPLRNTFPSDADFFDFKNFIALPLLSVPAALLDALRREEQEHSRHGQVIDQRRKGETVVDEILKGGKKA